MSLTIGIDMGSTYTKAVIADPQGRMLGKVTFHSGFNFAKAAEQGLELILEAPGVLREQVDYIAATGYGRYMVPFRDLAITELTCHARALFWMFPGVRTVLDIGGQTVKAIRLDGRGRGEGLPPER